MKKKTDPDQQMDTRTLQKRRREEHVYSGMAYKHLRLHPAMFCSYDDDGPNWFCKRCGRRIAKRLTEGDKPISVCNVPGSSNEDVNGVYPVRPFPRGVGEVVERKHRSEPVIGVGHSLMRAFRLLKISLPKACNCTSRLMYLSTMPVEEIKKFESTVLGWFEEEASHRAMFYDEEKAKKLLHIAYRHATKAAIRAALKKQEKNG